MPTGEGTLHFRNAASKDSPILSDILAIDAPFQRGSAEEFILYRNKGDNCTASSYLRVDEER